MVTGLEFCSEFVTSFRMLSWATLRGVTVSAMSCSRCVSGNQAELTAEIDIHFSGRKNLDRPSVFVFPKLLARLDCAFLSLLFLKPN